MESSREDPVRLLGPQRLRVQGVDGSDVETRQRLKLEI